MCTNMPTNNQAKATAINFFSFYLWTGNGELHEHVQTNLNFKSHDNDEMYAKFCEIENAAPVILHVLYFKT